MNLFFKTAFKRPIVLNACRIALFVGTALNLINQGKAIFILHQMDWGHGLMNYVVPYCVATYSAVKNELGASQKAASNLTNI